VEGDSQVIISLVSKIIHGSNSTKVSPSWRLLGLLEDFITLLRPTLTLIPSHMKREANKFVDHLDNEGFISKEEKIQMDVQISPTPSLLLQCMEISQRNFPPPDGVPHSQHEIP